MNVSFVPAVPRAFSLLLALVFVGCNESGPTQPVEPEVAAAETSIFIAVGESRTIAVAVVPASTPFQAQSDDTAVATVSQSANAVTVTGVGVGFATVRLVLPAFPGYSGEIVVEVTAN